MKRRWFLVAGLYAALIAGGWLFGGWISRMTAMDFGTADNPEMPAMAVLIAAIYLVASAVPFVPGAEIGLALIAVFGSRVALLVYSCMVGALLIAFLAGRYVPLRVLAAVLGYLGLDRARSELVRFSAMEPGGRLAALIEQSPRRWVPFLLKHRYLALAVMLNVPGNSLLGGGGGLSLLAGMSGLFGPAAFFVTILVAVAPIPLAVLLFGYRP